MPSVIRKGRREFISCLCGAGMAAASRNVSAMESEDADRWFRLDHSENESVTTLTIRMSTVEIRAIANALADERAMKPICQVVDKSALGLAMKGTTYCARCRNQFGEIVKSHQFRAKNWASAWTKAVGHCGGGSFELVRGKCGSTYGPVSAH